MLRNLNGGKQSVTRKTEKRCDDVKDDNRKGVGRVSTPPDYIVISMSLEAQDTNYEKAMEQAALQIDYLNKALESVGFKKKSVKTVNFNVRTDYERVKDRNGNYKSVFNGYICNHRLKVEFDFDTRRLAQSFPQSQNVLPNQSCPSPSQ